MHLTFTAAAAEKLAAYLADSPLQLKFLHDTEGCGCVVSGVPALELVRGPGRDDRQEQGDPFPFLYEPRHEIYYEPRMKVDFNRSNGSFSLKSDNQIYTTNLRLIKPEAV